MFLSSSLLQCKKQQPHFTSSQRIFVSIPDSFFHFFSSLQEIFFCFLCFHKKAHTLSLLFRCSDDKANSNRAPDSSQAPPDEPIPADVLASSSFAWSFLCVRHSWLIFFCFLCPGAHIHPSEFFPIPLWTQYKILFAYTHQNILLQQRMMKI